MSKFIEYDGKLVDLEKYSFIRKDETDGIGFFAEHDDRLRVHIRFKNVAERDQAYTGIVNLLNATRV